LQKARDSSMCIWETFQDIRGNIPTVQDATKSSWKDLALTYRNGILTKTTSVNFAEIKFL